MPNVINKGKHRQLWGWALVALAAGLLISLLLSAKIGQLNDERLHESLTKQAYDLADQAEERIELYQYGLRGMRGAILTAGEDLSRELVKRYSATRDVDIEFPGARGFGFIRRVALADEAQFIQAAQSDDWPDFKIRQLGPHADERFVIQYIEPVERNDAAVGLDIASEHNRREAAWSSLLSGEVRLTGPITLVQATGSPQQSFLILMPVYQGGKTPQTQAGREQLGYGWSYAPLLMAEVMADLRMHEDELALEIVDMTDAQQPVSFFNNQTSAGFAHVAGYQIERTIYGRHWQFRFQVYPSFIHALNLPSPAIVFALGALISVLISALLAMWVNSSQRRREFLAQQERLASIVESSADGIISQDCHGDVQSWNPAAARMFGIAETDAIGRPLMALIIPPDLQEEEHRVCVAASQGEHLLPKEGQRCRADGTLLDVSVSYAVIHNADGKVVGVSESIRDISAQKAAQEKIIELNSNLERQVEERAGEAQRLSQLLQSVLDSASEVSIIATDQEGTVTLFNQGAERMLGYRAAEFVGVQSPAVLHVAEEVEACSVELEREYGEKIRGFRVFVYRSELEGAETREWTYIRKDGQPLLVSLSVTTMRDSAGEIVGYLGIAMDISEQRAQHDALAATSAQLAMAADVAQMGIWSWTPANNDLQWNDRMFELYQQPLSLRDNGLNYDHWRMRIHPDDLERTETALNNAVAGIGVYDPVFRVVLPDGRERSIQAGAQVELAEDGTLLRVTGINSDITEQLEYEARLREAKEAADAASAAKSAFLANMSHEIRTPMNAVLGMLKLVSQTDLSGRQRDYVNKSQGAAGSLLSLLNDILDYSKIEAGKLQLDRQPFNLDEVMRNLAVVISGNLGNKPVEVLFDLDVSLPQTLMGDSNRLQQILINLAGNALKFTSSGYVTVRARSVHADGEQIRLRIEVEDTGIGISADNQQRIFDGFTQAEVSTSRRFGGTGLGLVICKRLVSLMNSELHLHSELGKGSCFWFELDLPIVVPEPYAAPQFEPPLRVLLVEDNPVTAELLQRDGCSLGWNVEVEQTGTAALQAVVRADKQDKPYQVILLDWQLPDNEGTAVAQSLIDRLGSDAPPVILISAYGRESLNDVLCGDNPPFCDFLSKPITPVQLSEAVMRVLHSPGEPVMPLPPVDSEQRLAGMRILVVEDNEINREIAFELLSAEGAVVELAEGGLSGVDHVFATEDPYDVVIMDMQMPDIDGLEATRRIRADGRFNHLPILAMTANVAESDRQACLAAGMNAHVGKPIDLDNVVHSLLQLTGHASAQVSLPSDETALAALENRDILLQRFGNNQSLLVNMSERFMVDMTSLLCQLDQQWQEGRWSDSAASLHTLKGTAATMGAVTLARRSGELEQRFHNMASASASATENDVLPNETVETAAMLAELQALLSASYQALVKMSGAAADTVADTVACGGLQSHTPSESAVSEHWPDERWREALAQLHGLLQDNNMAVLELVEQLPAAGFPGNGSLFKQMLEQIEQLDFTAAKRTLIRVQEWP